MDDGAPDADGDALRQSVSRDLQRLLNARRAWRPIPQALDNSIMGHGLSDFSAGQYNSIDQRTALIEAIRAAVEAFEPRLEKLEVRLRQGPSDNDPLFHIVIAGILNAGDDQPTVVFETTVEAASTDVIVADSHD